MANSPHHNGASISQISLSGSVNKSHPCFTTFKQNIQKPIKGGYSQLTKDGRILVGGSLDSIQDPRFVCMRATHKPLSSGSTEYKRKAYQSDQKLMQTLSPRLVSSHLNEMRALEQFSIPSSQMDPQKYLGYGSKEERAAKIQKEKDLFFKRPSAFSENFSAGVNPNKNRFYTAEGTLT